ncbi:MAG: GNAT family N-acetyltransferase [Defluviitaleaceae bacterium]|nr:GNAT family N-acetyltransferase [Defluviitaleaceae bacterium]
MSITYRTMAETEYKRIMEIDNTIFIKRVWRKKDGAINKQWIDINWQQDSNFPDGNQNHLAVLKETFEKGGFVVGAFDNEKLVGFCSINRDLFGKQYKYALLDQLFISNGYRGKGIGKKLFFMAVETAKSWAADKFYICAGSSEDTLAFYISLGCENAKEVNQKLFEQDENDIQLEYDFTTMELPIKSERLCITKFYETMAESTHLISLDENNRRFVPDEVFETVDEAREIIETIVHCYSESIAPQIYAVMLHNIWHIGHVQIVPIEEGWEVGYHISESHTQKGYATEAVKAFLPKIMQHNNITEIYGITHADNIASRKVLENCGFTLEFEGIGEYQGLEQQICRYVYA